MKKSALVSVGISLLVLAGCASTTDDNGEESGEQTSAVQLIPVNRGRLAGECAQGDGLYCGGHGVSAPSAYLFRCSGSRVINAGQCVGGCLRMPDGQNDTCATSVGGGDGPPASACPYGNGLYCGGNGVAGGLSSLYSCVNGAKSYVSFCSSGCVREAAGINDHCR
jgi:hypothetical protein